MKKALPVIITVVAVVAIIVLCIVLFACGQASNHQGTEPQKNNNSNTETTTAEKKETTIVDNENYKITIVDRCFKKESRNSNVEVPTLAMIIENKTNFDLEFIFKQVSINGFSVDVHHNPENGISSWPVIVNAEKKTKFYLAMLTDTIGSVEEIKDFETTLTVNQILEMSQYYDKSEKTSPFDETQIKAE